MFLLKRKGGEELMKRILLSLLIIGLVGLGTIKVTQALFSDTETSNSNTFAAGTLDLTIDGNNGTNTVKFNLTNVRPGNQPTGTFRVKNIGSINGYLDLHNISIISEENSCTEPEVEAGDVTCGTPNQGELDDRLGYTMYIDYGCDGSYSTGDRYIYNGMANAIGSNYDFNESLTAGQEKCVRTVLNWWSGATDNLAQNDSMTVDMTYELGQDTAQ